MKAKHLLLFFFLLSFLSNVNAQSKKEKQKIAEREMMRTAVLEARQKEDRSYAKYVREAYNRSSWVGSTTAQLIDSWGPPSRVTTDGGDGQIVVYDYSSHSSGGSYTPGYTLYNGYGDVVGGRSSIDTRWTSTYSSQTSFYTTKDKVIRKVKFTENTY